jgi:hypothetical protein
LRASASIGFPSERAAESASCFAIRSMTAAIGVPFCSSAASCAAISDPLVALSSFALTIAPKCDSPVEPLN